MLIRNILKPILSLVLSIILTLPSQVLAQDYVASDFVQSNPFLYKVEKDGKISHILGTMHAGIPLESFPKEIFELATNAKVLSFEADSEEINKKYGKQMILASVYPKGQSLAQFLTPEEAAKLTQIYNPKILQYQPWAIAHFMQEQVIKKVLGEDAAKKQHQSIGIDNTLLKEAKKNRKPLVLLDDPLKIIKVDTKQDLVEFKKILSYPNPQQFMADCFILARNSYLLGSESGIEEFSKKCDSPDATKKIESRNVQWIPKLEPILKRGDVFVAFGASHLFGQLGVIELLQAKGFKITRVYGQEPAALESYERPAKK